MFEVIPKGNRWAWQLITAAGRVIAYSLSTYPCDRSAAEAAKHYRSAFWQSADTIDHRQARCI